MREKLYNLGVFVLAIVSRVVYGRATCKPQAIDRIFVVATGKLGDVVCTTPVFRAIRKATPHTKIVIQDDSGINEQILDHSGLVDGYIAMRGFVHTVRLLRAQRFDAAVLTGPGFFPLACILAAGIPCVVVPRVEGGYCPYETRPYKWLLSFVTAVPFYMGAYAPRERLRALEPLGITTEDTQKNLGYSDEARKHIDALLRTESLEEKSFAVISPGSGNKIKEWPSARFAEVAGYLWNTHHIPVVIIGSARDRREVQAMVASLPPEVRVVNTSEQLSIDQLKALIARARLFISVDTGPIYIAEAFDVPTIDVVGPMDEHEQPPRGTKNLVVVPPYERTPQLHIMNARIYDAEEARRQTESITTKQVCDAIAILI